MADPADLPPDDRDALLRWRLAIGPSADARPELALGRLGAGLARTPAELGELDRVLAFVYGDEQAGGRGATRPYLPEWLAAVRRLFQHDVIAMVQQDAIERRNLKELLLEPETLPYLERNVELVATLVAAKGLVPDRAKEVARQIVREVVDELRRKLETETRTALRGAIRRARSSPHRSLRNLDWHRTIRTNLDTWDRAHQRLAPRRFHFWSREQRHHDWDVALLVDQSGSMAESVVYASVMAAIFASLDALRTRMLLFDTELVDVTPLLSDPVELLFSAQLGGGTDIDRAVAYAQANFVERPERTLMVLVTDLCEGGDAASLIARLRQLVDAKVRCLVLLALTDDGRASYDHARAAEVSALGIPCFGCTPRLLVQVVERILRGGDPRAIIAAGPAGAAKVR